MSAENINHISSAHMPSDMTFSAKIRLAAEAGLKNKPLIEFGEDSDIVEALEEYGAIINNGLRKIATGDYGPDYHGVTAGEAKHLRYFLFPESSGTATD